MTFTPTTYRTVLLRTVSPGFLGWALQGAVARREGAYLPSPQYGARTATSQSQNVNQDRSSRGHLFGGAVAAMWVWLRLWLEGFGFEGFRLDGAPAPVSHYTQPMTRPLNREERMRGERFARRGAKASVPQRRAVPAERHVAIFSHFGSPFARRLSPAQFLERLCRLSLHGRARLYGLRRTAPRAMRRFRLSFFERGAMRAPCGVWAVHLWPG